MEHNNNNKKTCVLLCSMIIKSYKNTGLKCARKYHCQNAHGLKNRANQTINDNSN